MVAKQEIECGNQIGDDNTDFKYGPGFVSKLRYKYLTLTLRQTNVSKQRPSLIQLRRTTSLNNLLDEDGGEEEEVETTTTTTVASTVSSKENGNCTNGNHHLHTSKNGNGVIICESIEKNGNGNGNGIVVTIDHQIHHEPPQVQIRTSRSIEKQLNLKRARSVEALLRDDQPIVKIISPKSPTIEDKIINARERPISLPPKRLVSLIDDDERPPPGITKQTMRLFESSTNKKRNVLNRPMSNEIANKVALFKGVQQQTSVEIKPMIGKKPIIPPRTTSPHLMNNSEKFAKLTKEKTALPKLDINIIKNNLETKTNGTSNGNAWSPAENKEIYRNNSSFSPVNSDTSSPNVLSPFRNSMSPQLTDPPKTKQTTVESSFEFTNEMNSSNCSNNTVVNSPLITSLSNKLSNLHMDTTITTTTNTPASTITSTPKNNSWSNSKSNNLLKIIDESTTVSDKETNGINADNSSKVSNVEDYNGSGKVISFSQKVHNNTKSDREKSPTPETMRNASHNSGEIAKVNVAKESTVVIQKPSHAPPAPPIKSRDNERKTSPTSSPPEEVNKWTVNSNKKKSWSSQQNDDNSATSIVFNFSDRKDVPDYIDNDGLIIRRRREIPKVSAKLRSVEVV